MLKILKTKKAQASASEYAITIALVIAALSTMTVFINRAIQARIRNTARDMVRIVRNEAGNYYDGVLYYQYEPYFLNTATVNDKASVKTDKLMQDGISIYDIDSKMIANTISTTAPAKDYKATGAL